ncbi:MAG TPA: DUF2079 domain-containing protein [Candidatus Dormibacteraeota bacterium]|nr:DUF2079 domain-containing protein [Candidatus Dormibacteraeota bacterium]
MARPAQPSEGGATVSLRVGRTLAGALTLLAFAAYASISVYRHEHYASNAFDLAVQDQTVWGYSRGEFIYNTVLGIPNLLGDHFHPILMTLAPFMLVWNSAEVLLVAQAVLLAVAGIPIYLWAERELGPLAGVAFQAAYLVFWGVLAGVVYDFHHAAFAVPALSTALYATLTRRTWLLVPAVVWAMLTREDIALTLIALGFYILVVQRRWIVGPALMVVNAVWLGLLLNVVIPALGGGVSYRHWTYDALGSGPVSAATNVLRHPLDSLKLLFTPATKTRVWIGSFAAFALLPMVSPVLLVALPSFLERFWSSSPNFWSFHFQYSMVPAPILTFAAIDTCARARKLLRGRVPAVTSIVVPFAVLAASAVVTAAVNPIAEITTYLPSSRVAEINECLATIPSNASVTASNTLVPHLSHRAEIYEITLHPNADYVAVDPSTYADFFTGEEAQLRNDVRGDLAAGYGVVCAKGTTLVLARVDSTMQLTPQLDAWLAGKCSGRACAGL